MAINGQYICIELNDCKTQLKAKSHSKIAEIVENGAYLKRTPGVTPKKFVHVAGLI